MKVLFEALTQADGRLLQIGPCIKLAPEHYVEGGTGFFDDVDVTLLSLRFATSTGTAYDKPGNKVVPLLIVDMLPEGTQDVRQQFYSCGDLEHFTPTADGESLTATSAKAQEWGSIRKDCNAATFLASLVAAGVPASKLDSERISDLAGIKCHVVATKREAVKGSTPKLDKQGNPITPSVLTVSRIISTPWGTPQAGNSPAVATAKAAAPAVREPIAGANGTFDDDALTMLVLTLLQEAGGSLGKPALMQAAFKAANAGAVPLESKGPDGKPARAGIPARVTNDAFLQGGTMWRYDGGTLTLIS